MADINLKDYIRDIPDFPIQGILFRDITPLLASAEAMQATIDQMAAQLEGTQIDVIAAAEARGFIFAPPLALKLGVGVVPIRKPGKLPYKTISYSYDLEYGTDTLQIHEDAVTPGANVLIVDDLLATGGTVQACGKLVEKAGGRVVACSFVIELVGLRGRDKIKEYPINTLIQY